MSQKITAQHGDTITLEEAVPGALSGKEDLLVALNSSGKAVLFAGTSPAIGVHAGKLAPDSTAVTVRLFVGGTVRVIQNVAIAPGSLVAGVAANARVAVAAAPARALGYKLAPGVAGAAGDVIEIIPSVETLAVTVG
jgi:hypothetical protein